MAVGRRRGLAVVAAALLCVLAVGLAASTAGPASVQEGTVVGRPVLELFAPDNRVLGGEVVDLEVFVSNSGLLTSGGPAQFEERVKTARNVRISVDTDRLPPPLAENVEVLTGQVPAGTVPEGVSGPFLLRLEVNESIPPGTYDLPLRLAYDYTTTVQYSDFDEPRFTDISRTDRATLSLVVRDRPRFELSTDGVVVTAGETAVQRLTVTNVGSEPAVDGVLVLSAANGSVAFGGDRRRPLELVTLGTLAAGESRSVPVRVGAPADLPPGAYPVSATVRYESPTGVRERSPALTVSVPVGAEQTFAVEDVTSTLRVGERGVVTGRLVNTGGRTVTNAAVLFPPNASGVRSRQPNYAVGSLDPGESRQFEFVVDVTNDSTAGPRVLDFRVRYRDPGDDLRTSDAVDAPVRVATEQTFALRDVEGDLRVAGTGTLRGTVVNTGDEPVTDAVVVVERSGAGLQPRETQFPVGDLAPDETATFRFPADVSGDADPGPQFVGFRVRYRGQGDEVRTSDPLDASVDVAAEQSFRVSVDESSLQVGDTGTVRGVVVNTGERPVENAALVVTDNRSDVRPREAEYALGTLRPGERARFEFTADVPRTAGAGPRLLGFRVRYRDDRDDVRLSDTLDARVPVAGERVFELRDVTTDLRVGERGQVRAALVNTGVGTATDATLLYTANGTLQPLSPAAAAGTLDPGDSTNVSFTFDVPRTADPGQRPLTFRVRYRGRDDELRTSAPLETGVRVAPEQTFALRNVTSTLRVDDTGSLRAELVNTGAVNASGVVLVVEETATTLVARETEYAVGSLAPGETAPVSFRADVTADAEPGPRLVTFRVRYRGQADRLQQSDPLDARVAVAPERDEFRVTPVNATVPVGGSTVVTLRVENRESEPLRDVRARLFVDDPLSTDDEEAFVPRLGPGETETLRFSVAAGGGATPKTYPLLVDFSYRDASGDSVLSDTYFVPVTVTERPPRRLPFGLSVGAIAVVGLFVLGASVLVYWFRESRSG